MPYLLVRQKALNYHRWQSAFDAHSVTRQARGSRGGQVFRSADDCNEVSILIEWDLERTRQFSQSEEFRAKTQDAGVLGTPEFSFLEEIEQLSR